MVDLWGSMVGGVDIGTEWNLKIYEYSPCCAAAQGRYRNTMEFKDCSIGVKPFPVARR